MRDVFEAKKKVLDNYLKSFKLEASQKGVLVFIGGEVAGLDFVSREQAFGVLHAKLLKSYAIEAMLIGERAGAAAAPKWEKKGERETEEKGAAGKPAKKSIKARGPKPDEGAAREFLGRAAECGETPYESVGLGTSLRYEGQGVIGSALAVDDRIIHMAFFKTARNEAGKAEHMAPASTRRRFRTL
jgi:hypothetical protein